MPRPWRAVNALAGSQLGLIVAELLPTSMLTPMSAGLKVSEGLAGQAVTATAISALVASLVTASFTRGVDRKMVLISFSVLLAIANGLCAFATGYLMLMAGRICLGFGIGGFSSMMPSVVVRLVPCEAVPRALATVLAGVSIAMIASAPLGAFLETVIGWRGVFAFVMLIAVVAVVWQALVLPSLPWRGGGTLVALALLRTVEMRWAMLATTFYFGSHWMVLTYARAFLEQVTDLDTLSVTYCLVAAGIATVLGTIASGWLVGLSLRLTLALTPAILAVCAVGIFFFGASVMAAACGLVAWGFAFGVMPVAWTTWITRNAGTQVESAGGLQIASIQLAITAGAAIGGALFDQVGPAFPLLGAGAILLASGIISLRKVTAS